MNADEQATLGAHPVLSCTDAAAWEHQVLGDDEEKTWAAMTRAGRGVGRMLGRDLEEIGRCERWSRVLVLCGPGHNGGDALVALRTLFEHNPNIDATVLVVPGFAKLRPLVRRAMHELWSCASTRLNFHCVSGSGDGTDAARVTALLRDQAFDVCIDGLYGMNFKAPFRPPGDWLIRAINAAGNILVRAAVDLPSGLGERSADEAFRADFTYATGIAKRPLFEPANRPRVGRVRYVDIGFFAPLSAGVGAASAAIGGRSDSSIAAEAAPTADLWILTERVLEPLRDLRDSTADKRTYGHVFVVGGSRAMPGAVFMAVKAALYSGVGLVTAFVPETLASEFAAQLPEAMWVPMPETLEGGLALEGRGSVIARAARCTGLLAGPGLGRERETLALVGELIKAIDVPIVLDADALQPEVVAARGSAGESPLVLTPHQGEFQRVAETKDVSDQTLREAAQRLRAVVVLKGAPTRVSDGKTIAVSPFGGPVLARGGSGDVLAGLLAGRLAQDADALTAAARGVVWHGMAADRLARVGGQTSQRISALCDQLGAVLRNNSDG